MKNYFYTTVLALALITAYAVSQTGSYPSSNSPSNQPQGGATTKSPDASQSTSPSSNSPSSDTQKGTADQSSMPQSDRSTAAVDDQTLTTKIQQQLTTNPALSNVNVTVNNGVATLEGKVSSKQDRKQAKQIVESVPGVKKVKDKLTVESSTSSSSSSATSPSSSSASSNGTSSTSSSDAGMSGSTAPNTTGSIAGNTQNGASSSSSAGTTPPSSSTSSGTASQQTGSSTSQSSGQAGTGSTGGMPQSDVNAAGTDNTTLQNQIQGALKNEPTLANDAIVVVVSDNSVDLSGTAGSKKERQTAKRIAQSYANNRKVTDHITVSGSNNSSTGTGTSATPSGTTPPDTTAPNQNPSNPNQQSQPYPH
ncbi:MAG TPA: BON domain-containing protein [Terriglobales bacterium]|nr:BON domain-containing protein [Terriglobales bacterium]